MTRRISARRVAVSSKRTKYRGAPGRAVLKKRHDYVGDGPSFVCQRCGATVAAIRPRHAWGGGKASPWSVCEDRPTIATDVQALPVLTEAEARSQRLVSRTQVARRFGKSPASLRNLRVWPDAVARLDLGPSKPGLVLLYAGDDALEAVRWQRPKWSPAETGSTTLALLGAVAFLLLVALGTHAVLAPSASVLGAVQ